MVTPQDFYEQLHKEFNFTLDAAASAQDTKCEKYFDEQMNSLIQPWTGSVWVNPPYGRTIGLWVKKAIEETYNSAEFGLHCSVVMLLPARTDTKWFELIAGSADEIRFVRGRLKFSSKDAAPFPSMVAIWAGDNRTFGWRTPADGPYQWNLIWRG